ncbi:MAG: dTDP-glucose 4,6-dehydratase [Solirubrobacterales bacterium]
MKTFLITGGAGFIGSNFVMHILKEYLDAVIINLDKLTYAGNINNLKSVMSNKNHIFIQGDICDKDFVENLFSKYDIDYVVNFAAESHVDRSIIDPETFVKTNVLGTLTLLNASKNSWEKESGFKEGKKFVQISTDEVYGSLGPSGLFKETTPLDPHSPYSASKAAGDMIVKSYFDTYGMPVNITRCSNNYGPFQFPEKLIPLVINNCLKMENIPIYGDGLNVRDWLYVIDHCRAIELIIKSGKVGQVYNIGGNNEKTNIDIVSTIIKNLNTIDKRISDKLITYVSDRKGHDKRYGIDAGRLKDELGWFPETDFEEGIKKTIKWYLDNINWMENITKGEYRDYYKLMYES